MLNLKANGGSIEGRTMIQKLIYFEQTLVPFTGIDYTSHFYGPFSRNVAAGLAKLYEFSFIDEKNISQPVFDMHRYILTTSGKRLSEKVVKENSEYYEIIHKIVTSCNTICNLRAHPISYAAKIHHIVSHKLKNNEKVTNKEIQDRASDFGWDMDEKDIQDGKNLLVKLDLKYIDN